MKTYDARLMAEDVMTTEQVAEVLRITPRTVYRWVDSGKLHPIKLEKRLLFPRSEVMDLLRPGGAGRKARAAEETLTVGQQAEYIADFVNRAGTVAVDRQTVLEWLEGLGEERGARA